MTVTILTLFPELFSPVLSSSILGRAQNKKLLEIRLINIRDFATDKHQSVDDRPYGGGAGMLLRVDILYNAIQAARIRKYGKSEKIILTDPAGKIFNQAAACRYSHLAHLIIIAGHYEGFDARINNFVDEKISIGKYVLTGGEIPAMAIVDAVARLTPRVLAKTQAITDESFTKPGQKEYPQYTRPEVFKGLKVPPVLLSGNHKEIEKWKEEKSRE